MTETTTQPMTYDNAWRLASTAKWAFESYYKYSFCFTAKAEGYTLTAVAGGYSEDIYRFTVGATMTWDGIQEAGEVRLTVADKDGRVMWEGNPL